MLTFAIHKKKCVVYFFGFLFALFIQGHHILLGGVGWSQVEPGGAGWSQVEPGGARWSWVELGGAGWSRVEPGLTGWSRVLYY